MKVVFIRHAESQNNLLLIELNRDREVFDRIRHPDPPLTALGQHQASTTAYRVALEHKDVVEIWCSFMHRALDTAAAIKKENPHVRVIVEKDIGEIGGIYVYSPVEKKLVAKPGASTLEIQERYPEFEVADPKGSSKGWNAQGEGKEPVASAKLRAEKLVERLVARARDVAQREKPLIIITHGDFFRLVFACLQKIPPASVSSDLVSAAATMHLKVENASLTTLKFFPLSLETKGEEEKGRKKKDEGETKISSRQQKEKEEKGSEVVTLAVYEFNSTCHLSREGESSGED